MDNNVYNPANSNSLIVTPGTGSAASTGGSDISRVLPRQLSTGSTRGTQTVGYGTTKIDGTNNTITIGAPDGSTIGLGAIPNSATNEYGFFSLDANGKLIMKIVNGTKYVYDPKNSYVNITQDGLLPDGSGGFVSAKTGTNVADAYS